MHSFSFSEELQRIKQLDWKQFLSLLPWSLLFKKYLALKTTFATIFQIVVVQCIHSYQCLLKLKKIFPNCQIFTWNSCFSKVLQIKVTQMTRQPTHHQILHDPLSHPVNISQIPTITYIHPNSYPFFPTPLHLYYGKMLSSHNTSQLKITQFFTHCTYI